MPLVSVRRPTGGRCGLLLALLTILLVGSASSPTQAADPAVEFMERVSRELIIAARSRSPQLLAATISRYGANSAIALSAIGDYRRQLAAADEPRLITGTVGFLARYAAAEAPKYPIDRITFAPESRKAKYGLMVDSTLYLKDGNSYDVRWLLVKAGSSYRVRDAQVMGFWMTPFLQRLYENYIGENGGNVRSLVVVLNR